MEGNINIEDVDTSKSDLNIQDTAIDLEKTKTIDMIKEEMLRKPSSEPPKPSSTKSTNAIGVILVFILLLIIGGGIYLIFAKDNNVEEPEPAKEATIESNKYLDYRILSNALENFDLYFLQLENEKVNKVYSPLSIKYALEMLADGATGASKDQITNIIGTYHANKYNNSINASLANALFVKNDFEVNEDYINMLTNKYNAEVVYDSFENTTNINNWISDKTLGLIKDAVTDVKDKAFILTNALAIDMEWVEPINIKKWYFSVGFAHEDYSNYLGSLCQTGLHKKEFEGVGEVDTAEFHTVVNKYDIVKTLGEDAIRKTVGDGYEAWVTEKKAYALEKGNSYWLDYAYPDKDDFLNRYIEEINKDYGILRTSTDYRFFTNDIVKVFAKDLKEYDSRTLEYIAIMPTNESLDAYIENTNADKINTLLNKIKPLELSSFEEGYVTEVTGFIPMFKFDYELKLEEDLSKLGITNVFDSKKANLTNIANGAFITDATHKANIEFSNDGIKAAATTEIGGAGGGDDMYDYLYEVPVKKIDLTFDKPYMFIIRDKNTSEVWFMGTVYNPLTNAGDYKIQYCGR